MIGTPVECVLLSIMLLLALSYDFRSLNMDLVHSCSTNTPPSLMLYC